MTEEEKKAIVARLMLSTKRKSRQYSLLEIAEDLRTLKNEIGLKPVADILQISIGMVNQFLSFFKLPYETQEIVKSRKIDSVAIVHHLSKLNPEDIPEVTRLLLDGVLSGQDLRILVPFRKQYPSESIESLVDQIKNSKNIKISVIRIKNENTNKSSSHLKTVFGGIAGEGGLISIENKDGYIDIKLTKEGEKQLRIKAKQQKKSLNDLVNNLIN